MAITITQQPTYPNVTHTDLLYVVSSDEATEAQFQYVMDIVSGSQVLNTVRQYPNPAGDAVFDPSRILDDYLLYDPLWTISSLTPAQKTVQTFTINFGEEYGTSSTSPVTLYNGSGSPGRPAVTGTPSQVFPGVVERNNGVSYNWQAQNKLSDRPSNIPISSDDYVTISLYDAGSLPNTTVTYKNAAGSTIATLSYNTSQGFSTIPVSSKNVSNYSSFATIDVNINGTVTTFTKSEDCNYDRLNFAFINKYGFWDYYGVNLPVKRNTTVQRDTITKTFVDWSTTASSYDITRRGKDAYNTMVTDNYSVSTDWLDQTEAAWLSQMIESPSVFLQQGTTFVPVSITNADYVHNTNARSQKAFQYEIQYQFSNQRRSR